MAATTGKLVSTASTATTPAPVASSAELLAEPNPKKTVDSASDGSKTTGTTVGSVAGDISGVVNNIQKKIRRAERFGVPVQLSEQEKRNSRAERFGLAVPSTASDDEAKKKARLARFASYSKPDSVEEEKRKARAIRFSNPQSSFLQEEDPIAGKAAGEL